MIQLNRIHITSQTPSHVEITKMLSTNQPKIELLTAIAKISAEETGC